LKYRHVRHWLLAILLLASIVASPTARALDAPRGQTIVTIVGAIAETNRGPFDEAGDKFFLYHEYKFDKAASFDLAMLEALGVQSVEIAYDGWPAPIRFEGPLLADLLAAVGAQGTTVTLLALDGYAERIEGADIDAYRWILATRSDGAPLPIGGHGPTWLVYDRGADHRYTPDDEARWPWAVFLIVVE
jgi:hypothetical protein